MGFFSWNCKGCGHPLLSSYAAHDNNLWMVSGVAITKRGRLHRGGYDGYGRLNGVRIDLDVYWSKRTGTSSCNPDCYHRACWLIMGQPLQYKGGSENASDQGYFFDPDEHNVDEPKSRIDLKHAKLKARKTESQLRLPVRQ
jgi:hypothetical protein